jgi:hypothetical protein
MYKKKVERKGIGPKLVTTLTFYFSSHFQSPIHHAGCDVLCAQMSRGIGKRMQTYINNDDLECFFCTVRLLCIMKDVNDLLMCRAYMRMSER